MSLAKQDASRGRFDKVFSTYQIKANLKERMVRSSSYMILSHACQFAIGFATVMILARLLTPRDFGLLAMAEALTRLVNKVKDFGLPAATIQRDNVDHEVMSGLFWFNFKLNMVLVIIIISIAPILSWFFKEPNLTRILLVLAAGVLVLGVTNLQLGLLRRQMRFGTIGLIELTAMIAGSITGIVLAILGMGFWALVFQQVVLMLTQAAGFWSCCEWRPQPFGLNRQSAHEGFHAMRSFGKYVTYSKILIYLSEDFFRILVGRFAGAYSLGLYQMSYRWSIFPFRQIYIPLTPVVVSTLSRIQNDAESYRRYLKSILLSIFTIAFPAFACLFIEAKQVVLVLLGPQWSVAVPLFKILVLAAAARSVIRITKWIYISEGRPNGYTRWLLIATPITLIAVSIGIHWGIKGVAMGYLLAMFSLIYPALKLVFQASPLSLRDLYRSFIIPIGTTTISAIGFLALKAILLVPGDTHPVVLLFIHSCIFGCLYLASWLAIAPCRKEIFGVIRTIQMIKTSAIRRNRARPANT